METLLIFTAILAAATQAAISYEVGSVSRGFSFSPGPNSAFTPFLVSKNRGFATGFLRDSSGFFTLAVVGIDPTRSSSASDELRILDTIWMANRNSPIRSSPNFAFSNETGKLRVSGSIPESAGGSSWESSGYGGRVLELADSGNLILRDDAAVWQSFDHPTEVLMQGQNFTQKMRLVSSISAADSAAGDYSMQLQGDRLILFADWEPYWATAALKEHGSDASAEIYIRIQEGYLGMYQSEQVRVHFLPFSSMNRVSSNLTRRARLYPDGNLRIYYWQDGQIVEDYAALDDPCKFPDSCGDYGVCSSSSSTAGKIKSCSCANVSFAVPDPVTGCRSTVAADFCAGSFKNDDFREISGVDYLANDVGDLLRSRSSSISSLTDCKSSCLANCSCKAFFFRNDSSACFHTGILRSMQASPNPQNSAFIRLIADPLPTKAGSSSKKNRKRTLGISLLVLAVFCGSSLFAIGCYYVRRLKRQEDFSDEEAFLDHLPGLPKRFQFREIESSINSNRHSSCSSRSNRKFSVFRVERNPISRREFKSEVASIATLGNHTNLVPLLGFCVHEGDLYLVYEDRPGWQTLDEMMKMKQGSWLDWSSVMKILVGIATGVAYIHGNSYRGVSVHGKLGAGSVILDESLGARLGEYGVCGLRQIDAARSASDDVYEFGLIVEELVKIGGENAQMQQRLGEVAARCCAAAQEDRPSMQVVLELLSRAEPAAPFYVAF